VAPHRTSPAEIKELLGVADRDLAESQTPGLSPDWKLSIAYNAALQMATAALAASGYRAIGEGQHYRVIQSLSLTIGAKSGTVIRFDAFRKKRNISDYQRAGAVSSQEAEEMYALAKELKANVESWLRENHPEFLA
jgi:hypothetical protein